MGRVSDRATFDALRAARWARRGPLSVKYLPLNPGVGGAGPGELAVRVAYAIGRDVGGAVVRNRIRRRLRAAVDALAPGLAPGAYLVGAGPDASDLGYPELVADLSAAITSAIAA